MAEIYIACKEWKRKDGLFETLLYEFNEYTPEKGDLISLSHETKGGEYVIISRLFDFEECANNKGLLTGLTLNVERVG